MDGNGGMEALPYILVHKSVRQHMKKHTTLMYVILRHILLLRCRIMEKQKFLKRSGKYTVLD